MPIFCQDLSMLQLHLPIQDPKVQKDINISMLQRSRKVEEFRRQLRRQQRMSIFKDKRDRLMLIEQQKEEYRSSGKWGAELLNTVALQSDKDEVTMNRQDYPRETLYPLLQSIYDGSNEQLSALKILDNYFYMGCSSIPEESLVDNLLRIMTKGDSFDSMKQALLILWDIVQDNFGYCDFLVREKKIVPKLLSLFEENINNAEVKSFVYKIIHFIAEKAKWDEHLALMMDPLLRAMHEQQNPESITDLVETLYCIVKSNQKDLASILYHKKILNICELLIRHHESRVATVLYLKFLEMFANLLTGSDVAGALGVIRLIQEKGFKVGKLMGRYSVSETKVTSLTFINRLLRSENEQFRELAGHWCFQHYQQLESNLMSELQADDEKMLPLAVRLLLVLYLRRPIQPNQLEMQSIRRAIDKCVSYRERIEMEEELTYLKTQRITESPSEMDIEI